MNYKSAASCKKRVTIQRGTPVSNKPIVSVKKHSLSDKIITETEAKSQSVRVTVTDNAGKRCPQPCEQNVYHRCGSGNATTAAPHVTEESHVSLVGSALLSCRISAAATCKLKERNVTYPGRLLPESLVSKPSDIAAEDSQLYRKYANIATHQDKPYDVLRYTSKVTRDKCVDAVLNNLAPSADIGGLVTGAKSVNIQNDEPTNMNYDAGRYQCSDKPAARTIRTAQNTAPLPILDRMAVIKEIQSELADWKKVTGNSEVTDSVLGTVSVSHGANVDVLGHNESSNEQTDAAPNQVSKFILIS